MNKQKLEKLVNFITLSHQTNLATLEYLLLIDEKVSASSPDAPNALRSVALREQLSAMIRDSSESIERFRNEILSD